MKTLIFILVFASYASDVTNGKLEEIVFDDVIEHDFIKRMRREVAEECDEGKTMMTSHNMCDLILPIYHTIGGIPIYLSKVHRKLTQRSIKICGTKLWNKLPIRLLNFAIKGLTAFSPQKFKIAFLETLKINNTCFTSQLYYLNFLLTMPKTCLCLNLRYH